MVQRAILSQRLVDESEPPEKGERWIADTVQRGFGLRLWRSPSGELRKAYCIRITNQDGKSQRRTMPYWEAAFRFQQERWWEFRNAGRQEPTLGELIGFARRWAHDELALARGRPTLAEEDAAQRALAQQRIKRLTFAAAAGAVLSGMEVRGLSRPYRDHLYKLFSVSVPAEVAAKNVCDVSMDDIASLLGRLAPGNVKLLRPFLGQLLNIPERFGLRPAASSYDFRSLSEYLPQKQEVPLQLRDWTRDEYASFVMEFENEQEWWQQANCLRLFFCFHAPLTQILAARWDQIWEINPSTKLAKKHYQWRYREGLWKFESIRAAQIEVLQNCLERGKEEFGETPYWFPSRYGRQFGHIRSVDHVWRTALFNRRLQYISPITFRKALHATHPWFGYDFSEVLTF